MGYSFAYGFLTKIKLGSRCHRARGWGCIRMPKKRNWLWNTYGFDRHPSMVPHGFGIVQWTTFLYRFVLTVFSVLFWSSNPLFLLSILQRKVKNNCLILVFDDFRVNHDTILEVLYSNEHIPIKFKSIYLSKNWTNFWKNRNGYIFNTTNNMLI